MNDHHKEETHRLGWYDWLIFALLCVIWGTSFILIKKGLIAFSYDEVAVLRISITMIAFLPILFLFWKKIDWSNTWKFLFVGVTGSGIPSFLFPIAQTEISSSVAGILNSLTPIFTLIAGIIIFRMPFEKTKLFGVLVGFAGACLLILSGGNSEVSGNWLAIFIVIATICYGLSVNAVKAFFQNTNSLLISAMSFSLIGPPALIYVFMSDIPAKMQTTAHAWESLAYITTLALLSTVLGTVLFFRLIQRTNAIFGASISYLIPVVALAWGLVDGEQIHVFHVLSMLLILLGVYLVRGRS